MMSSPLGPAFGRSVTAESHSHSFSVATVHRSCATQYSLWACLTTFSRSCRLTVVVVGAAVVAGVVGAGSVAASEVVGLVVEAAARETGGTAVVTFLALPPHEERTTSVTTPAKVFNFDMQATVTAIAPDR